jgi:hypothetical protein
MICLLLFFSFPKEIARKELPGQPTIDKTQSTELSRAFWAVHVLGIVVLNFIYKAQTEGAISLFWIPKHQSFAPRTENINNRPSCPHLKQNHND